MNGTLGRTLLILVLIIAALALLRPVWAGGEESLPVPPDWDPVMGPPQGPSDWERAHEGEVDFQPQPADDPPPWPVVQPAEWEPMTGALIRYPLGIPVSLVAEMSEDVTVVTIVSGTSQQQQAYNQYQSAGVNMANCEWLIAPSNSMWTRDYGPWFIFTGNDEQGITDHIYNRPYRPDDNMIPWEFGAAYNIPVYGMEVVHTGGNYMSDGMGIAMSTDLVYDENPSMTPAEVDAMIHDFCGVDYYDVVPDILSGGIHHIDCWAKMLNPGKILVKRLDPPNPTLEANVEHWENEISSYGKPYEIVRVDCYSSTPYTNSLILNNKVFVPLFGSDLDDDAMQTYQEAMPGYEILGYTGSWVSDDAIHCRVMGITDRYMLRIVHVPLFDRENNGQDYPVEATIHAYSNLPLSPGMPEILWRLSGSGSFTSEPMTYQGNDLYVGYIPQQPDYSVIEYYIHAEDESGRSENHPYIGPADPHRFIVAPDTIAPQISHQPLGNLSTYEWPPVITAQVTDNTGIAEVSVEWFINGVQQSDVTLLNTGGSTYSGQLSGTVTVGDNYEYRIVAVDASQAANTSFAPASGYYGGDIVSGVLVDMEDGAPGWTHSAVLPGFNDQWHLSTQQNHTSGGSYSWKCGDTGYGNYGNLLDAGLVSQEFTIEAGSRLTFWHRMAAEISSSYPGYAYDGGLVEISVNGGNWQQITPVGGYPYLVRQGGNPGPFPAETPIFSGHTNGWEQVDFDLSAYSGNVRFRFRFGSDGSVADEGWFIDDVLVVSGGATPPQINVELTYISGSPVPASGGDLVFDVFVENYGSVPLDYDAWLDIEYEGGTPTTVVQRSFTNYQPGWTINRPGMYFPVPASYAAGNYEMFGRVGIHPDVIWDESGFPFTKEGMTGVAGFQPFVPDGVPDPFTDIIKPGMKTQPSKFALLGCYPNPFNPTAVIRFYLPQAAKVTLDVFDVNGRRVLSQRSAPFNSGANEITFDGSGLASGIYIYRLTAGEFTATGKMVLMK